MKTNILTAVINIANYGKNQLPDVSTANNRVNLMGDALETYVRDAFCDSFKVADVEEKLQIHKQYFSYIGNSKNPPDFIINRGDAVEVKKRETRTGSVQLNSSPPKKRLRRNDSKITAACRDIEGGEWTEKSMIYAIGYATKHTLKELFLVDGECYVTDAAVYENIFNRAKQALEREFVEAERVETKEIAKIVRIDALETAYLRVRPMWVMEHPNKLFPDVIDINTQAKLNVVAILPRTKFDAHENVISIVSDERFDITIKPVTDPSNPNKTIEIVFIHLVI